MGEHAHNSGLPDDQTRIAEAAKRVQDNLEEKSGGNEHTGFSEHTGTIDHTRIAEGSERVQDTLEKKGGGIEHIGSAAGLPQETHGLHHAGPNIGDDRNRLHKDPPVGHSAAQHGSLGGDNNVNSVASNTATNF